VPEAQGGFHSAVSGEKLRPWKEGLKKKLDEKM
jgi:hypothetical protein